VRTRSRNAFREAAVIDPCQKGPRGVCGNASSASCCQGSGGEGIEGLANAPTAHDPCIELDVGRGRCLDGELNGCGYCDMFVVGKIDRRMF
jgi:hypothetical protein